MQESYKIITLFFDFKFKGHFIFAIFAIFPSARNHCYYYLLLTWRIELLHKGDMLVFGGRAAPTSVLFSRIYRLYFDAIILR